MINGAEVIELRERFSMPRSKLAEFMRVDARTVATWENGMKHPKGSASAVLIGLREALDQAKTAEDREWVIQMVRRSVELGGLSYLLLMLFERLPYERK